MLFLVATVALAVHGAAPQVAVVAGMDNDGGSRGKRGRSHLQLGRYRLIAPSPLFSLSVRPSVRPSSLACWPLSRTRWRRRRRRLLLDLQRGVCVVCLPVRLPFGGPRAAKVPPQSHSERRPPSFCPPRQLLWRGIGELLPSIPPHVGKGGSRRGPGIIREKSPMVSGV